MRGENVTGRVDPAGSRVQFEPRDGGMGPEAINVRKRAATPHPSNGRIEPSRRHGPFDPRFGPRPNARDYGDRPSQKEEVQDWESEGGASPNLLALTQRPRPPERERRASTRPMSNLIAKIRSWLGLGKTAAERRPNRA